MKLGTWRKETCSEARGNISPVGRNNEGMDTISFYVLVIFVVFRNRGLLGASYNHILLKCEQMNRMLNGQTHVFLGKKRKEMCGVANSPAEAGAK